jgi:hypothetical protein
MTHERLWLHVGSHLRLLRRSRIVFAVGLVIVAFWTLALLPLFFGATDGNRFNQLRSVAQMLGVLGWFLSAGLGLFVTSTHLRNKSVQVILTRPGSPQIWLASIFLAALVVAAATQLAGALVTFALSLIWGVPYQVGFLYLAIDGIFEAAIAIAILTTLGAAVHPVVALLAAAFFNETTFEGLRFGVSLEVAQGHGGTFMTVTKALVVGIHEVLPMLDPFDVQTRDVTQSLRVDARAWGYLGATGLYSLAVTTACFLLSDLALRRRSFASTT